MRRLYPKTKFRKDVKRLERRGKDLAKLGPDWLLLYRVEEIQVILARTGTHADLFDE